MKKVEIETECGEVSTIYVSQDVTKVTVDGEEYGLKENEEDENDARLPRRNKSIQLKRLLEEILRIQKEYNRESWLVAYETDNEQIKIEWAGSFPKLIFKL